MLLSHYIWIIIRDRTERYLDLDCELSEVLVACVPPKSFEDHPLLWMVVRS